MYEVMVKGHFSAAHQLREYKGKCESLHGHNFTVEVFAQSEGLNHQGLLIDFQDLKRVTFELLHQLDHRNLNEILPFDKLNPTSENLARWLFDGLKEKVKAMGAALKRVNVWEAEGSCASFFEP